MCESRRLMAIPVSASLCRLRPFGTVADELPVDGIEKRLERRIDDVRADADGRPPPPRAILAVDDHPRDRLGAALGDPDLEVDQP